MTWSHLSILLAIGAIHSSSLWLVTLGAKKSGASARLLRALPLLLGVPSAFFLFPIALRLVTGVELVGLEERLACSIIGVPAAIGAEAVYRLASTVVPRITDALIKRLSDE
jgi:hypothetical protein